MTAAVTALLICAAGGIGAALRLILDGLIRDRVRSSYPVATTVINLTGSLLLGLLTGLASAAIAAPVAADRRHRAARRLHHLQHRQLRNRPTYRGPPIHRRRPQRGRHADHRNRRRRSWFRRSLGAHLVTYVRLVPGTGPSVRARAHAGTKPDERGVALRETYV
jgi:hypothetical protein